MAALFQHLTIRVRLALITVTALAAFGLVGVYAVRASLKALERTHGERMADTADLMLYEVGTNVNARITQMARAATRAPVRRALARANALPAITGARLDSVPARRHDDGAPDGSPLDAQASRALEHAFFDLSQRLSGHTVFTQVMLSDRHGRVVAAADAGDAPAGNVARTVGSKPWWRKAKRRNRYVQGIVEPPGGRPGLAVAVRLNDAAGRMVGIMRAFLSVRWIAREAASATQLRQTMDVALTTRDGRLIHASRPFNVLADASQRPYFRAAQGKRGYVTVDTAHRKRLYAHARNPNAPAIGGLGWHLFLGIDRRNVLADAHALERHMTLVFGLLLVVGLVTALFLGRSLVRPLTALRDAARAMAEGDLSRRVRPEGRDELAELGQAFNTMAAAVESQRERLTREATTDGLTGVPNRRHFMAQAEVEWERCHRHVRALSVLMLDIDHFKNVNDIHGHDVGDAVLKHVAALLGDRVRASDILGRLGGEEFAVLLPETHPADAARLAERLRAAVAGAPCPDAAEPLSVTVSIGLAGTPAPGEAFDVMLKQADEALYAAKEGGRNRVIMV